MLGRTTWVNKVLIVVVLLSLTTGCIPALPSVGVKESVPQTRTGVSRLPVAIDAGKTGEPISKYIYGQFIEHQGRCIYGGIWAEMIQDRKFLYPVNYYFPWGEEKHRSPWEPIGFDTVVEMDRERSYVGEHTPRVQVDGRKPRGIAQGGLALREGKQYEGRIALCVAGSGSVQVDVSLVWGAGANDKQTVTVNKLTDEYAKATFSFTAGADTDHGRLEIVGRGEGAFRIGAVSLMPADNVHGMRADTIKLLKELGATVYRWPGGIFVNDYDWHQAVGDRDKRPPRENRAYWSVDVESNDFGLDEFMAFCEVLGAEPYVVVSATGPGDADLAAAEVEYCNGSSDTPMGQLRAANGHPEPYNVKFWGVGNEMWGFMPLDGYVERHDQIATAMRQVDPAIKLIAVGGLGMEGIPGQGGWTEVMLQRCAGHMDLISEHMYGGSHDDPVAHSRSIADGIRGQIAAHRELRERLPALKGRDIRLALDEWNYFWGGRHEIYGEAGPRYTFKDALGIASGLHEMFRNTDMVTMANTHPVNVHGHVKTTQADAALEATGLALKLYRQRFGTLPVAVDSDTSPLDVVAAWTSDRNTLTVAIVNPTGREYALELTLKGAQLAGPGRLWLIAHADPRAYNEPGQPPQVTIEEKQLRGTTDALRVAPLSISLYELPVR